MKSENNKPAANEVDLSTIDAHLDAVLRASGSALRHYSMQKTLDDMRAAMRAAMTPSIVSGAVGNSLLRAAISPTNPLPPGCYCPPGQCQAPRIMGRQTPCRDPEKRDRPAAQGLGDLMAGAGKVTPTRVTRTPSRCAGCAALLGEAHAQGCRFAELT